LVLNQPAHGGAQVISGLGLGGDEVDSLAAAWAIQ
jgi:hypothetical protein